MVDLRSGLKALGGNMGRSSDGKWAMNLTSLVAQSQTTPRKSHSILCLRAGGAGGFWPHPIARTHSAALRLFGVVLRIRRNPLQLNYESRRRRESTRAGLEASLAAFVHASSSVSPAPSVIAT